MKRRRKEEKKWDARCLSITSFIWPNSQRGLIDTHDSAVLPILIFLFEASETSASRQSGPLSLSLSLSLSHSLCIWCITSDWDTFLRRKEVGENQSKEWSWVLNVKRWVIFKKEKEERERERDSVIWAEEGKKDTETQTSRLQLGWLELIWFLVTEIVIQALSWVRNGSGWKRRGHISLREKAQLEDRKDRWVAVVFLSLFLFTSTPHQSKLNSGEINHQKQNEAMRVQHLYVASLTYFQVVHNF